MKRKRQNLKCVTGLKRRSLARSAADKKVKKMIHEMGRQAKMPTPLIDKIVRVSEFFGNLGNDSGWRACRKVARFLVAEFGAARTSDTLAMLKRVCACLEPEVMAALYPRQLFVTPVSSPIYDTEFVNARIRRPRRRIGVRR